MKIDFGSAEEILQFVEAVASGLPEIEQGIRSLFDNAPGADITHEEFMQTINADRAKEDEEDKKFHPGS